jgi:hypothetical protein
LEIVIWSRRLARYFGPSDWHPLRSLESRHWQRWGGYIDPDNTGDDWLIWDREPEAPAEALRDLTDRILPAVLERTTDAGLYADWSSNDDPFLGPVEQLAYRAVLARDLAMSNDVDQIRKALRESPDLDADYARPYIERLTEIGVFE